MNASQSLTETAIALSAAFGVPVFPQFLTKAPATPGGFKDATCDRNTIRRIFTAKRPGLQGQMIGTRTGQAFGLIVVDIDIKDGCYGQDWLEANDHRLPVTRTIRTQSGGLHMHFTPPADGRMIATSASSVGLHVDIRGEDSCSTIGPAPLYELIVDAPLADMPEWLIEASARTEDPAKATRPPISAPLTGQLEKRYAGITASYLKNVRNAPDGQKHEVLLNNAIALGGIIDHAGATADEAVSWLVSALPASVADWRIAARTARDGIKYGRARPMELQDRPRQVAAKPAYASAALGRRVSVQVAAEEAPVASVVVQLRPAVEDPAAHPNTFGRLRVLSVEDAMDVTPRPYLLEGLIAPGELSVWYGQPKCGKSFLMLRVAYGLALGQGMWGREAEQSAVLYVAAEGEHGVMGRIRALHEALGPAPLFRFIAQRVDLRNWAITPPLEAPPNGPWTTTGPKSGSKSGAW